MAKTYTELCNMMERNSTHTKVSGRTSKLDAGDMTNKGIESILTTSKGTAEGTAEGEGEGAQEARQGEEVEEEELFEEDLMLDDL
jgi:hypothetical protein